MEKGYFNEVYVVKAGFLLQFTILHKLQILLDMHMLSMM